MSKILDQIKRNAVPEGVLRSAAKGALPLEPAEMLEILVYLTQNPVFAQEAKMTLARFDVVSTVEVVSDPAASPEVIGYFWMESNRRTALMPAMIENPAVTDNLLMEAAATGRREMVSLLLASPRARSSPAVVEALATNSHLRPEELRELLGQEEPAEEVAAPEAPVEAAPVEAAQIAEAPAGDDLAIDSTYQAWQQEHAAEIAAEEGKPFELTGAGEDEGEQKEAEPRHEEAAATASGQPDSSLSLALTALGAATRLKPVPVDEKKLSLLQRIGKMKPGERVRTAFIGNRDERMILIRDGAKIVQNAVLASPRLTEPEVESMASATNVTENVLREIARSRRFMKNYNIRRNLTNNPKCPLDLSLNLVKNLMVYDLKSLRHSKSVPETLRRLAAELYKEKTGPAKEIKRKT
jgi:hypothetical protein